MKHEELIRRLRGVADYAESNGSVTVARVSREAADALEAASLNERSLECQIADLKTLKEQTHRQLDAAIVDVKAACVYGLAAIGTYGRRDEQGLTGLSKQHFQEISAIHARSDAALSGEGVGG